MSKDSEKAAFSIDDKKQLRKELFCISDEQISKNIFFSIKSRYKILYIVSSEETRIIEYFQKFCISETYTGFIWDCSRGLIDIHSDDPVTTTQEDIKDEEAILSYILDQINRKSSDESTNGRIYLLLDYHKFLDDAQAVIERKLKEFSTYSEIDTIVIVAPEYVCGSTLDKEVTVIDFPYPSKFEIEKTLGSVRNKIALTRPKIAEVADEKKEELIHAVTGLTLKEAKNAFGKTIVQDKTFKISTLLREKELIVKKSRLLEICNTDISMEDVGGYSVLKDWLVMRRSAFSDDAIEFGLPSPKGTLIIGCPGTGKSLSAKAVASLFEMPLIRLDMGSMFASRVGESEQRMRTALQCVESISPVICWLDESDKAISGTASSAHTDGGTTARVVSTLLTWMQEKQKPVFIIATANSISNIPPEFMRAGRFDEVFFLDLPNLEERADITGKLLRRKKRDETEFDLYKIAKCCENFVGAEIEKAIDNSLFLCYYEDKRKLTTDDICSAFKQFVPLYQSRKEEIQSMRTWAKEGGAVIANSSPDAKIKKPVKIKNGNTLDMDKDEDILI